MRHSKYRRPNSTEPTLKIMHDFITEHELDISCTKHIKKYLFLIDEAQKKVLIKLINCEMFSQQISAQEMELLIIIVIAGRDINKSNIEAYRSIYLARKRYIDERKEYFSEEQRVTYLLHGAEADAALQSGENLPDDTMSIFMPTDDVPLQEQFQNFIRVNFLKKVEARFENDEYFNVLFPVIQDLLNNNVDFNPKRIVLENFSNIQELYYNLSDRLQNSSIITNPFADALNNNNQHL